MYRAPPPLTRARPAHMRRTSGAWRCDLGAWRCDLGAHLARALSTALGLTNLPVVSLSLPLPPTAPTPPQAAEAHTVDGFQRHFRAELRDAQPVEEGADALLEHFDEETPRPAVRALDWTERAGAHELPDEHVVECERQVDLGEVESLLHVAFAAEGHLHAEPRAGVARPLVRHVCQPADNAREEGGERHPLLSVRPLLPAFVADARVDPPQRVHRVVATLEVESLLHVAFAAEGHLHAEPRAGVARPLVRHVCQPADNAREEGGERHPLLSVRPLLPAFVADARVDPPQRVHRVVATLTHHDRAPPAALLETARRSDSSGLAPDQHGST
eukprot:CAMPEP_0119400974 /NCGR_PEP_ID=MMETSP1334-20130426/142109_1 /TAXON_ID=127549 /ORGANISM="Calcidiscus leptoporus, Strain RCC1130" /LENGTH=329 /DNA_ID=CAMNT_0007424885 /DNA_START=326 /DNA_END=1318 /DNA_ORIENTATION=+